jgi:hypothetical protein
MESWFEPCCCILSILSAVLLYPVNPVSKTVSIKAVGQPNCCAIKAFTPGKPWADPPRHTVRSPYDVQHVGKQSGLWPGKAVLAK